MARRRSASALAICLLTAIVAFAQNGGDSLSDGFISPPDSAKPRTWWHWTSGNVSEANTLGSHRSLGPARAGICSRTG